MSYHTWKQGTLGPQARPTRAHCRWNPKVAYSGVNAPKSEPSETRKGSLLQAEYCTQKYSPRETALSSHQGLNRTLLKLRNCHRTPQEFLYHKVSNYPRLPDGPISHYYPSLPKTYLSKGLIHPFPLKLPVRYKAHGTDGKCQGILSSNSKNRVLAKARTSRPGPWIHAAHPVSLGHHDTSRRTQPSPF